MINVNKIISKNNPTEEYLLKIEKVLKKCCDIYYSPSEIGEESPLTDEEFDNLMEYYNKNSSKRFHTGTTKVRKGKKGIDLEHTYPDLVGTLYKTYNTDEVVEWFKTQLSKISSLKKDTITIVISLKYDGNSATGIYRNRNCIRALTRGKDGKGMDLSNIFNGNTISTNDYADLGIKYEVITTQSDFNKICEIKGKSYANMRTIVAGILGEDNGEKYQDYLTFVPLKIESINKKIARVDQLAILNSLTTSNNSVLFKFFSREIKNDKNVLKNIEKFVKEIYDDYTEKRLSLPYMIDGLVIEFLDEDIREFLGRGNFENKYEVALKFPYMIKKSKVLNIDFRMGVTGRVTPVVKFSPVYFNGAKCENVSIANYKRFKELSLAKGDTVSIEYHGDVLSYLNKVKGGESGNPRIKFINKCPICGNKLKVTINDKNEKTFVYCPNNECNCRQMGKIYNYVKKIEMKGIGEESISDLFKAGLIETIPDLYKLTEDDIQKMDGYLEGKAKNIMNAINSKRVIYDYQLMGSLLIKNFGLDSAKVLCSKIPLNEFIYEILEHDNDALMKIKIKKIEGFNEKTAGYIVDGIKENEKIISELIPLIQIKSYKEDLQKEKNKIKTTYEGEPLTVVVTGDLKRWQRNEFKNLMQTLGHKLVGSISGRTDYLITNDTTTGTVKNKQAKAKGIPIVTEDEFIKILGLEF